MLPFDSKSGPRRWVLLACLPIALAASGRGEEARLVSEPFDYADRLALETGRDGLGWEGPWVLSRERPAEIAMGDDRGERRREVLIQGTRERNNPLRRQLAASYRDEELFIRFRFRYDPERDATGEIRQDLSEFFVFWLDRLDGGDRAVHGSAVPNIGVHVADSGPKKGRVVFIARIGQAHTAWSRIELERGRTYSVVGRLSKTESDPRAAFDRFELWVDPRPGDRNAPDAAVQQKNSVNFVRWVGFATGRKTEPEDRILIDDVALSRSWEDVLDLERDAALRAAEEKRKRSEPGVVWTEVVDFRRDIYPLLKKRCFSCHKGANSESGYRLDVYSEILGYSTGDPLAEPGRGAESRIVELCATEDPDRRMPPVGEGEALNDQEVALLRAWIDQGLKWDSQLLPEPNARSDHWSFQPIERPAVPEVRRRDWPRTAVDAFILAKLEEVGIEPSPEVGERVLQRRLSLDLTGLPPVPTAASSLTKGETWTEALLGSPHYGERMARLWLDLARWAESHGYQHDIPRPYAWRYRDYVIDSFNADKPYDRFLREQLAGDELRPYADEHLVATGFLGAARISGNNMDKAAQRNDVLFDIVNATGSAVLGLTLECAQCHNHKFDPISQRDYYRMQAFFVNGQLGNLALRNPEVPNPTDVSQWMSATSFKFYRSEAKKLIAKKRFADTDRPHTWGYYSPLTGDPEIERLPVVNRDPIAYEPESLRATEARLLVRGDIAKPGPVVKPGWPEVLSGSESLGRQSLRVGGEEAHEGDGPRLSRSDLADWLSSRENPLVARVWANRIWQLHFGRGLVETASDFGLRGAAPSHPELLDWLAVELIENGWSTKHLHRLIVDSATYRQAAVDRDNAARIDPDNRLLWRWPRRRLEAEAIRDAVLVATGELDRSIGGPSVPSQREANELRRTLYLAQRRSEMPEVMTLFDGPEALVSCSRRDVSTVALQPLYLLNSPFMEARAVALAKRVREQAGAETLRQVELAFERVLGRAPDTDEKRQAIDFLAAGASPSEGETDRLLLFCQALLNLNEFLYLP